MLSDTLAGCYIEIMEDFWSGRWNDSNAAFVFFAVFLALLFGVPFFWSDIVYYVGFAWDVVMQPVYGGALLLCVIRMRRRRRNGRSVL